MTFVDAANTQIFLGGLNIALITSRDCCTVNGHRIVDARWVIHSSA